MAKTAAQTRTASKVPLSLKVTLYGTKPPVWRRLLIPGEMTLGDLHQAIQAAMSWDGGHLHVTNRHEEHRPACVIGDLDVPA